MSSFQAKPEDESEDKQLLRLTIQQALQSQYVMEHTRGIDAFLTPKDSSHKTERKADTVDENEHSLTTLVGKALKVKEAKNRHLTAGFSSVKSGSDQKESLHFQVLVDRLGRELSAIGLSADSSYLSLTNKRGVILDRIVNEYQREYRLKGMALSTTKDLPDTSHTLLKVTISSGVFMMLTMLENSAISNPKICMSTLQFLREQLSNVKPCELETNESLPIPCIAENAFDSIQQTLFNIASNEQIPIKHMLIRSTCLELLLMLSVSRGTLNTLLSCMYLLLFKQQEPEQQMFSNSMKLSLIKLRTMRRELRLDLPNFKNQILKASILNAIGIGGNRNICMTTDGYYLYTHSSKGLSKIGTGINNTSPGFLEGQVRNYRSSEKASIACCGDLIFFRSVNISKYATLIVISTQTLTEIGYVLANGKGTYETADNTGVQFGLKTKDDGNDGEFKEDEKTEKKSDINSVRMQLRTIQSRIIELEEQGMYDGQEIDDLECEYEDIFESLPPMMQDEIEMNMDAFLNGDGIALDDDSTAMLALTAQVSDPLDSKDDDRKDKKSKIPRFNPIISDGRFLYAIVPVIPDSFLTSKENESENKDSTTDNTSSSSKKKKKKDDKITHINLKVNAFDPDARLEHCYTTVLKRPLPTNDNIVLDFNPTEKVRTKNAKKGGSGSYNDPYGDPYGYDPYYSRRRRRKGAATALNTSAIDLGCPPQLCFAGSLTMECWLKLPNQESKRTSQQVFHHGDGSYWTYIYIQSNAIYAGCNTPYGSTTGYANCAADLTQWTHIAATFDSGNAIWRVYINGNLSNQNVRPGNIRSGPQASRAAWTLGSVAAKPFYGKMCDVRIWSCARSEEDIKKNMKTKKVDVILDDTHLRGYWPLNDGLGLTVSDISYYSHFGFVKDCQWKSDDRPFKLKLKKAHYMHTKKDDNVDNDMKDNDDDNKVDDIPSLNNKSVVDEDGKEKGSEIDESTFILQAFDPKVAKNATFYTNGEILVICYPSHCFWKKRYDGIAQKFNLGTGLLTDEIEYNEFANISSACFVPDWKSMWVYRNSKKTADTNASCHIMAPPTAISRWRQDRIKEEYDEKSDELTPKKLATKERYGIINIDYFDDHKNDDHKDDDHLVISVVKEQKEECVCSTFALANIVIKFDHDTESLRTVDSNESVPMSLSIPFGVDLTAKTFTALLDIAQRLTDEFYATKEYENTFADNANENYKINEVRMLSLLTVIRLLRTNINHMIAWNVDPYSVGFNNKQTNDLGFEIVDSQTIRQRYVALLNRLVFERPSLRISKLLEDDMHSDVAECLSIGLSVFYMDPKDRVSILREHVDGCLQTECPNPLRLLLASRYFASLTEPHNLIALVPALIEVFKKENKSLLLRSVLQLVFDDAQKAILAFIDNPNAFTTKPKKTVLKSPVVDDGKDNSTDNDTELAVVMHKKENAPIIQQSSNNNLIGTLRQFLARISVCLFNDAIQSDSSILENYAVPYAFNLIELCCQLLDDINSKSLSLENRVFLVDIFRKRIGELLPPLISCFWSLDISPQLSSKILPHIFKLMLSLNRFMDGLPDVIRAETDFKNSHYERVVVERIQVCESEHPVTRGTTEKVISIPGAKSLKLTIDKQTFEGNAVGASLSLYRRPAQQDPIEGASFTSVPNQPIVVFGDTVHIVYNSGYQSTAWGFKIIIDAKIEEVRYDLPWLLDLCKNAAMIASKCAGSFISAPMSFDGNDGKIEIEVESQKKRSTFALHRLGASIASAGTEDSSRCASPSPSFAKKSTKKSRKKKGKKKKNMKNYKYLPKVEKTWVAKDFLSQGLEYSEARAKIEQELISWLPYSLLSTADSANDLPFDMRDSTALDVQLEEEKDEKQANVTETEDVNAAEIEKVIGNHLHLAMRLAPMLTKVRYQRFPTPKNVKLMVDNCVVTVFAVLIKHNNLTMVAGQMIEENISDLKQIPDGIIRTWKTAQKLRSWLIQKFQQDYAAKQQELQKKKKEEERKKEEAKKKKKKKKRYQESEHSYPSPLEASAMNAVLSNSANNDINATDRPAGMAVELNDFGMPVDNNNNNNTGSSTLNNNNNDYNSSNDPPPGMFDSTNDEPETKDSEHPQKGGGKEKKTKDETENVDDDMKILLMKKKKMAGGKVLVTMEIKNKKKKNETDNDSSPLQLRQSQTSPMNSSANHPIADESKIEREIKGDDDDDDDDEPKIALKVVSTERKKTRFEIREAKRWEVDKPKLYKDICNEIIRRCKFLLSVLAVQPEVSILVASISRTKSTDTLVVNAEQSADNDSSEVASKTAALTAWQNISANDEKRLKYVSTDQRFSIIWRSVLSFLDEKEIHCILIQKRIEFDRVRARMRAFGLRVMRLLIDSSSFAIVKREILHFLIPSLHNTHRGAFNGEPISVLNGLTPIGHGLTANLLQSSQYLMQCLKDMMQQPHKYGSNLLQAVMYVFTLKYDRKEFEMLIKLDIFNAIKTLLTQNELKGYKTSAWALLELLTTTILRFRHNLNTIPNKNSIFELFLNDIYSLIVAQLHEISQIKMSDILDYVPQLPPQSILSFNKAIKTSKDAEMFQRKVETASPFGIAAAADGSTNASGGSPEDDNGVDNNALIAEQEAFNVRVLSLINDLCRDDGDQIKLFAEKQSLNDIVNLAFNAASPRTKVVAIRILRSVLLRVPNISSTLDQRAFVIKVLHAIGQTTLAPLISYYFHSKDANAAQSLLNNFSKLRLSSLYSDEFVWVSGEQINLLRYLVNNENIDENDSSAIPGSKIAGSQGNQWSEIISDVILSATAQLPQMQKLIADQQIQQLFSNMVTTANIEEDSNANNNWMFEIFGALSVIGGYVDSVRVGTKVFYDSENITGIVTSRLLEKNTVSILRENEGTHLDKVSIHDVISLGDEPFLRRNFFAKKSTSCFKNWRAIICNLLSVLNQNAGELRKFKEYQTSSSTNAVNDVSIIQYRLLSLCSSTVNAIVMNPELLSVFIRESEDFNMLPILMSVAFETTIDHDCQVSASVLQDRSHILNNLCLNRCRSQLPIEIALVHDTQIKICISDPKIEFTAEFTNIGKHLVKQKQGVTGLAESTKGTIKGKLSYIKLDEDITKSKCKNKIVLIDTYHKRRSQFKDRLARIKSNGALACILLLHSKNAKAEYLDVKSDDDDFKKSQKKKNTTDVVEMAAISAMNDIGGNIQNLGFDNMMFGGFEFGGRRARSANVNDNNDFSQDPPALIRRQSSQEDDEDDGKTKKDPKQEQKEKENEILCKSLFIMAVDVETAHVLYLLSGIKEHEYPKCINHQQMVKELMAKGHVIELCEKALKKSDTMTVESADAWIKQNIEWLNADIQAKESLQKASNKFINKDVKSKTANDDEYIAYAVDEILEGYKNGLGMDVDRNEENVNSTVCAPAAIQSNVNVVPAVNPVVAVREMMMAAMQSDMAQDMMGQMQMVSSSIMSMDMNIQAVSNNAPPIVLTQPAVVSTNVNKPPEKKTVAKVSTTENTAANTDPLDDDSRLVLYENTWKLADKWSAFDDSRLRDLQVTTAGSRLSSSNVTGNDRHNPSMVSDKDWFNSVYYKPSHFILQLICKYDHALTIHYMRRALLSVFMNVNLASAATDTEADDLSPCAHKITKHEFLTICHIVLSLSTYAANELQPMESLRNPLSIVGRLTDLIRMDISRSMHERTDTFVFPTLLSSCQRILLQKSSGDELLAGSESDPSAQSSLAAEPKVKTMMAAVHGRWVNPQQQQYDEWGGGRPAATNNGTTAAILFRFTEEDEDGGDSMTAAQNTIKDEFKMSSMSENAKRKHVPKQLKIIIRSDPTLCNMGTSYMTIYKDRTKKNRIAQFSLVAFDTTKHVCIVNQPHFYYTLLSASWYAGCPPSNVVISVLDLTSDFYQQLSETDVLNGTIYSALTFISSMIRSKAALLTQRMQSENRDASNEVCLDLILLQLIRTMEFTKNVSEAQSICRIACAIFNDWKNIPHQNKELLLLLAKDIQNLEKSHEGLRTHYVTQWSSGSFPGPHVQALLELLLSAQTAMGVYDKEYSAAIEENEAPVESNTETTENGGKAGNEETTTNEEESAVGDGHSETKPSDGTDSVAAVPGVEEKASDYMVDCYTKFRDGPSKARMISLMHEKLTKSNVLAVIRDAQNRYMIDDFVCDVCVRGGGKWYYEVNFVGQCQYACIGFIDRKYRKHTNSGISNNYEGHSWSLVGPNTQYMYRGRNVNPVMQSDMDVPVIPNWNGGVVIGVKLNLDDNQIEYCYDGVSAGIAFSGFESSMEDHSNAFYPCISLNQNSSCEINLGGKPFKYQVEDYLPFESPLITSSSWLNRYQLASDVTYLLSHSHELPDKIIEQVLSNEASIEYSQQMKFEIVKCNALRSATLDTIFIDNGTLFNSTKPADTNICFKVRGFEATEFVLTGITIRCSTTSNGFKAMCFVGNNEPDFQQFDWCKHFNKKQFQSFVNRKPKNYKFRPHEPCSFLRSDSTSVHVKLSPPVRGKYLTLKIAAGAVHNGLHIEFVKFSCVHGKHPLSNMMIDYSGNEDTQLAVIKEKRNNIIANLHNLIKEQSLVSSKHLWSLKFDVSLTELSQIIATRLSVSVSSLDCVMLVPTKDELSRFKVLAKQCDGTIELLQARFALIKYLNRLVTPLLHYIDITLYSDKYDSVFGGGNNQDWMMRHILMDDPAFKQAAKSVKQRKEKPEKLVQDVEEQQEDVDDDDEQKENAAPEHKSLSSQVHILKGCYFMSTKKSVFDVLLASTGTSGASSRHARADQSRPRVTLNRIKASRAKQAASQSQTPAECERLGKRSVFGQLFQQLRNVRYSSFRSNKVGAQLWTVIFSGEGSIDVGGPYRESLTYAVQDLQCEESNLNMFLKCPNGKNSVGLNREKYVIRPSANSSLQLQMFEFVGVLMGIALRTKQTLSFDFPSLIWKQILAEKVDVTDLEAVDKLCIQALNEMEKVSEKEFEYCVYETFTTSLSDGTEVELCENGKSIDVSKKNYERFVSLVVKKRLKESSQQILAITKGLNEIVPTRLLSLFSWYDLEVLICGNPKIDVEALRRHTVYQGGLSSSSSLVKYFWKTLYCFSQEERQLFLRFVWGRNRLPVTEADWDSNFTLKALNTTSESLPIAHTCFFSMDLPPYRSFEQCRDKIRFSIHNCQAIDVDFNPNSSSLQAWIDDL